MVSNQLSLHLSQNNLLDPNQSGFKPAHSTETALTAVTEALHAAQAAFQSAVLILLDLSAAFDTVDHLLLLAILADLGIAGTALKCFSSYLADRTYQVSWKGLVFIPPISHSGCQTTTSSFNPDKTELLFFPAKSSPMRDLTISVV